MSGKRNSSIFRVTWTFLNQGQIWLASKLLQAYPLKVLSTICSQRNASLSFWSLLSKSAKSIRYCRKERKLRFQGTRKPSFLQRPIHYSWPHISTWQLRNSHQMHWIQSSQLWLWWEPPRFGNEPHQLLYSKQSHWSWHVPTGGSPSWPSAWQCSSAFFHSPLCSSLSSHIPFPQNLIWLHSWWMI